MEIEVRRRWDAESCHKETLTTASTLNKEHSECAAIRMTKLAQAMLKLRNKDVMMNNTRNFLLTAQDTAPPPRPNKRNDLAEQNVSLATENVLLRQSMAKAAQMIAEGENLTPDDAFKEEELRARIMQDRPANLFGTVCEKRNEEWLVKAASETTTKELDERQAAAEKNATDALKEAAKTYEFDKEIMIQEIEKDLSYWKLDIGKEISKALEVGDAETPHPLFT